MLLTCYFHFESVAKQEAMQFHLAEMRLKWSCQSIKKYMYIQYFIIDGLCIHSDKRFVWFFCVCFVVFQRLS